MIRVRVPTILKKAIDKSAKKYSMDSSKLLRYITAQFVIISDEDQRAVLIYWKLKEIAGESIQGAIDVNLYNSEIEAEKKDAVQLLAYHDRVMSVLGDELEDIQDEIAREYE